jgi:transposase
MRFVPIKTDEQLDVQAMHRVRDRLVQRRTALINEIRGPLLERGITFAVRPIHLRKNLPAVIEDAEQNLSSHLRWLLERLWQEWKQLESDLQAITEAYRQPACSLPATAADSWSRPAGLCCNCGRHRRRSRLSA